MAKKNDGIVIEDEGKQPDVEPRVQVQVPKLNETLKPATLVRFWSMKERHQIAMPSEKNVIGRNVIFKGHVFLTEDGGQIAKTIRGIRISDIREIIDIPFESEGDQAKFNKFLNDMVYTGERGMASQRGVKLLRGLFSNEEYSALEKDHWEKTKSPVTPDVIIMRALKTKSFKGGI